MRVLKWVSIVLGSVVTLVVLGVLVIVWIVDPNRFKPNIEAAVRGATGREFALVGDIDLGFFPWLALRTGEGRLGNAPGFGAEPMATWKSSQLGARLFPLLRGELVADRVHLVGADLRLVRHADGHANWEGLGGTDPATPKREDSPMRIDGISIEDSRVSFVDETVPRRVEITGLALTTDGIAPGEPFTDTEISGTLHMDGFQSQGVPFELAVPKASVAADYSSVAVKEFQLQFGGFEAAGGVGGTLGAAPRLTGTLESNEFDPRALLASLGMEAPQTTDPKALGKLRFTAAWVYDNGAIGIDPFSLALDGTHFTGDFRRGAGEQPVGEFNLRGDSFAVSRYIPPTDPASEPFVLPTAMLKELQFRGRVDLEQATYDDIVMKGVTLRLLLDAQGLRSEPAP